MDESAFVEHVAGSLGSVPGVVGVALGGSRAQGTHRADSDWDFAIYYRKELDPQDVRALGWEGRLTEVGGWGPIFNGGGPLTIEGRRIDVHYRDLELIKQIHDDAQQGEFRIEPLLFHQAGIPTYILLAELGLHRVLRGDLPRWEYPEELKRAAPAVWWSGADLTLHYAREGHARHGRVAQCSGLLSEAACRTAHAILAHRGTWITNEKQLLTIAGLREMDAVIARLEAEPKVLLDAVDASRTLLTTAVEREGIR